MINVSAFELSFVWIHPKNNSIYFLYLWYCSKKGAWILKQTTIDWNIISIVWGYTSAEVCQFHMTYCLDTHTCARTHTHTHAHTRMHTHAHKRTHARTRTHTPPRAELTKKTTHDCIWKYWIFIDNRCYLIKDEFLKVYTAVVPIKLNLKKYVTWWLQSTWRWNKLALHRILNSLKLHIMTIFN